MASLQPVDRAFLDDAPTRIEVSVPVASDRSAVWAAICDQKGWEDWFDGLTVVATDPPTWTAPGDTRTVRVNRLEVHERAIVVDAEDEWGFTIERWPLPGFVSAAEAVRLADREGGGTTMTYVGAFRLKSYAKPFWGVLAKQLRSGWADAFNALDDHLRTA